MISQKICLIFQKIFRLQYHINFQTDMSKPNSFRVEPWTAFPRDAYSILTDDFIHEKLLTVKVSSTTAKGTINLKNQVIKKDKTYQSSGEIKAWFPVWKQGTLYFKTVNKDLKLHYDNGITDLNGLKLNWYGSIQTHNSNQNQVLKLGAIYLNPNFDVDNRVRVSLDSARQSHISTAHKLQFIKNKWSVSGFKILNWNGAPSIARNAFRVGYFHNLNTSVFLRATNNSQRKLSQFKWGSFDEYFGYFAFNLTHKLENNITLAAQIDFTLRKIGTVSALVLKTLPDKKGWIKIRGQKTSSATNLALAYQGIIKDYGKWIIGAQVAGLGDKNVLKYGVQLDLNV